MVTHSLPPTPGVCMHRGHLNQQEKNERKEKPPHTFDPVLLEFLVCLLSKKPLSYEALTNELINEDLGIAYSIIDGIPNMILQAARMTHQNTKQEEMEH
ncbi:hypothetical protein MJG53_007666 [Ovis ammon polii x Ovis aries]|uniref:Uncharacterized protein n=1 Tax=Ovis ammon polii x Ovis aries TaxID=2918886 RepID=A0ACB9V398_9CETA|nr:hypothetical protein MJG53_007666 [Ovis ammon polii x Ovis aries]